MSAPDVLTTAARFIVSRESDPGPCQDLLKVAEELGEASAAALAGDRVHAAHELCDVILAAAVALCRYTDDPAGVLAEVVAKVDARIDGRVA